MTRLLILASVLLFSFGANAQLAEHVERAPVRFLGREVTINEPGLLDDFYPKGPASVCVEGPPQRQCYTAPQDFGRNAKVELVRFSQDEPALLFSAASGGVSGWSIHFALLRLGSEDQLENIFLDRITVPNQSEYALWHDPVISDAPIFVTAQYTAGPDEGHYGPHRYIVSAYVKKHSADLDRSYYFLDDQYMTARKYDLETNTAVLASEKQEAIARLRRAKTEANRRQLTPH